MMVGRFELVAPLGSGGVAEVWRARDTSTDTEVALKRLLPQLAGDRQVRQRLLREGEIASRLAHVNIVRVLEIGEEDARPYLVMELVGGEDLGRRLEREGRLSVEEARRIARGVAQALGYAHARGIVHRDLKPQNVLLADDTIKLTDFGLARVETFASLTGSSLLWGSPEYMAPELFTRGRVDPRTDLFSLGVMLHEMLTGKLPWRDGRSASRAGSAPGEPAPLSFALGAGEPIDRLVTALLSPTPADRPSSVTDVIFALNGNLPAPLVPLDPCPNCDARYPRDVPQCLACGHVRRTLLHTKNGAWIVVLRTMEDDADSMAALREVLGELTGNAERLMFVTGVRELYSDEERKAAIELPLTLFADLDEATARQIETKLTVRGLDVAAVRSRELRRLVRVPGKELAMKVGLMAILGALVPDYSWTVKLLVGGGFAVLMVPLALVANHEHAVKRMRAAARFTLRDAGVAAPIAAELLDAAHEAGGRLASPEVRGLFVATSRELYRLTRRAEEMAEIRPAGSSEEALARRLLALAPALGERLAGVAQRLETLDVALDVDSEGDAARALAALDRREGAAEDDERAALAEARRELEVTLDRRLAAEAERERLAASLCRLLATVRDLYQRAAGMTLADEHELAAIETALRELADVRPDAVPS